MKIIATIFFSLIILLSIPWFNTLKALEKLPEDIKWITNDHAPVFADPMAKKGGTFRSNISSFPLTLRMVGPDSNSSFVSTLRGNQMTLIGYHPNSEEILPRMATHWAFGKDGKTMYFKLDKRARWSDGQPVTADDYLFGLEFMRSSHILAPWYYNFYTKEINRVVKFDSHTIAIVSAKVVPDLQEQVKDLLPQPRHYYKKLTKDFVRKYNWKIVPNTGPYQISKFKKGKSITFKRKKDWWAKDLKYNVGRFNVDKITFKVIRDTVVAFEYFKKRKLDAFGLTLPDYWHKKSLELEGYQNGYITRYWFYTDDRESPMGFYLNQDRAPFEKREIRYAFAHSINFKGMIKNLLRGDYQQLHSYTTGFGKYTDSTIKAREYNIEKVQQLMSKEGWKRGSDGIWEKNEVRFSVTITYSYDIHAARLSYLKEEARKAGVELKLQLLNGSAAFKQILEKKHQIAWMGWGTGFRPQYWQGFHSDNAHKPQTNNITNTDNPELDRQITAYGAAKDDEQRIPIAHSIQRKIHEIGSFVPAYKVSYFRVAFWRWWKFPKLAANRTSGSLFDLFESQFGGGQFWLDEKIRKETLKAIKSGIKFEPLTVIDKTFQTN